MRMLVIVMGHGSHKLRAVLESMDVSFVRIEFSDTEYAQELWAEAVEKFGVTKGNGRLLINVLEKGELIWAATDEHLAKAIEKMDEDNLTN